MDDKKYNLICAVRIWALLQGMEVTTIDEIDLALKKDDSIYGFIIEPDRTEQELKTLVKDAFSKCNYVYVVTDDNAKRRKLVNIIPNKCGILCYGNSFGLGCLYQKLRNAEPI